MASLVQSLTTREERAGLAASFLIDQDWSAYTPEQHTTWAELVGRRMPQLREHACSEYLDGFEQIGLRANLLPDLKAVSARLSPRTGWESTPVSGISTCRCVLRDAGGEDVSDDDLAAVAGVDGVHALNRTSSTMSLGMCPCMRIRSSRTFLQQYGKVCAGLTDGNDLERMGRLFWFTVEFGLIRQDGGIKVYGSGLISSHGECTKVLAGGCEVRDFDLDAVLEQRFDTGAMQPVLYAVDSFEQIYEAAKMAEKRLG